MFLILFRWIGRRAPRGARSHAERGNELTTTARTNHDLFPLIKVYQTRSLERDRDLIEYQNASDFERRTLL